MTSCFLVLNKGRGEIRVSESKGRTQDSDFPAFLARAEGPQSAPIKARRKAVRLQEDVQESEMHS